MIIYILFSFFIFGAFLCFSFPVHMTNGSHHFCVYLFTASAWLQLHRDLCLIRHKILAPYLPFKGNVKSNLITSNQGNDDERTDLARIAVPGDCHYELMIVVGPANNRISRIVCSGARTMRRPHCYAAGFGKGPRIKNKQQKTDNMAARRQIKCWLTMWDLLTRAGESDVMGVNPRERVM